jgi:DNA end-binding protein Ku
MRAIWKGALAFGMVSIPVRLYSATEDRDVSFHQVHDEDAGRVHYHRVCTVCGKEVAYADLAKGFELPSGETVMLTDEDFANLPLPTTKIVELVAFVPADQVDPLALARGYYLEPEPAGRKPAGPHQVGGPGQDRGAEQGVAGRAAAPGGCPRAADDGLAG